MFVAYDGFVKVSGGDTWCPVLCLTLGEYVVVVWIQLMWKCIILPS